MQEPSNKEVRSIKKHESVNVLLTGGSGFVASFLENYLISKGYQVDNVSRSTYPTLEALLKGRGEYDFYIHTAGLSKDSPFVEMEPYMVANVELSRALFSRFQKDSKGKKFIFISSLYSLDSSDKATCYAKSKAMVERELIASNDSRVQIIRPALICAPPKARGILGPLQKIAKKGVGIKFPEGFKMSWVSIESIAREVEKTLVQSEFSSPLNLIDDVAQLNDPKNWLGKFETSPPRVVISIPRLIIVSVFNFGHLLKLPFNKHFLRKLQS